MKTYTRHTRFSLSAVLVGLFLNILPLTVPLRAQDGNWSTWQSCGDNVSVSFDQVNSSTWTWKFRNDGTQTITYMDFNYTDNAGQHYDVMPGSLQPGQVIGGWAAFTAASVPTIQLKTVQFPSSASPATNSGPPPQQNNNSSLTASQQPPPAPLPNSQPVPPATQLSPQQQAAQQDLANAQADLAAGAAFQTQLENYGKWMTLNGQSYWQPNEATIGSDWRPYCTGGNWVATDLGWTWNSDYDWGWAAFHYGRWADDPILGWIWQPGNVWAPAWVAWRNNDTYCGWAPLPPGAGYDLNLGFTFNGVTVSMNFGFGLGADDYCFINVSDMCAPSYPNCLVPPAQVAVVYQQTAVINNAYSVRDGRIVDGGISIERVRKATGRPITPVKVSLGPERLPEKGPIDGRLPMRQINFTGPIKGQIPPDKGPVAVHPIGPALPTDKNPVATANPIPRKANDVLDDLLKPDDGRSTAVRPAPSESSHVPDDLLASQKKTPHPAQASHTDDVINDLLDGSQAAKPTPESTHVSDDVMDRLLSSGHSSGLAAETSHVSDDVVDRLLARGPDEPPRPALQERTAPSQQYSAPQIVARNTYQQPVRQQDYQAPQQNYQPQYNQRQDNQQRYNQRQYDQQQEQERQQQREQQREQQEQERQQQLEQQREQQEQERQQQMQEEREQQEQERQQQMEQQRERQEQERQQQEELQRLKKPY
jgi:hypothetical protein